VVVFFSSLKFCFNGSQNSMTPQILKIFCLQYNKSHMRNAGVIFKTFNSRMAFTYQNCICRNKYNPIRIFLLNMEEMPIWQNKQND